MRTTSSLVMIKKDQLSIGSIRIRHLKPQNRSSMFSVERMLIVRLDRVGRSGVFVHDPDRDV